MSLLKNIFGVEIGQRMIVAEIFHLARQYIGDCRRLLRNEWKFWAPLRVSKMVMQRSFTPKQRIGSGSGGATFVAMMQTANLRTRKESRERRGGKNRDHAHDGMAVAQKSLGLLSVSEF